MYYKNKILFISNTYLFGLNVMIIHIFGVNNSKLKTKKTIEQT